MDVFQALADPVRRDLLRELVAGSARVVDLTAGQEISRPAISRHLRLLSQAGLVRGEDHGRERHYSIDTRPLLAVQNLLTLLKGPVARSPVTATALDALDTEVRRTRRDRRNSTRAPSATSVQQGDTA